MSELFYLFIKDVFFAALAGIGFSILSNPPLRALKYVALISGFGHGIRFIMLELGIEIVVATFFTAFIIGIMGMFAGHKLHCLPDAISFPSVLPLMPGILAYNAVISLVKFFVYSEKGLPVGSLLLDTINNGLKAVFILLALVLGVILSVLLMNSFGARSTRRK